MLKKYSIFGSVVLAATLLLVGCGGGDSGPAVTGSTLSGTAAGGVAVIGTVLVKDSLGATKGGTIDSTGHYNVDISGMTGPFILKATGTVGNTTVNYCSAATTADVGGTINITPFTNLILSNLLGQIAENYFNAQSPTATLITPAAMAAQETALQAKLAPIFAQLGIDSAIDLLRTTFAADHSGMDAVMDLVKVEVSAGGIATIKNAITNTIMAQDDVTSKSDDSTAVTAGTYTELTSSAVTDLSAITTAMNNFAKLYANGTPSVTTITNCGLFDTSSAFLDSSRDFAEFATQMSTDQALVGMTFSNIDILLTSTTAATLTAEVHFKNGSNPEKLSLQMKQVGTTWVVIGDQHLAENDVSSQAIYQPQNSALPINNGLKFWISPSSYNALHTTAMVASAHITGPGLAVAGIDMSVDPHFDGLVISGGGNHVPECTAVQGQPCVTIADVKDGSVYRIVLKDVSSNVLEDYNQTIHKAPVVTSTLTTASFPAITSTMVNGAALTPSNVSQLIAGANVSFTWTLPAGLTSNHMSAWAMTSTAQYYNLRKDFAPADTSATFTLGSTDILTTGTVASGGTWLSTRDTYNREFVYNVWF